MHSPAIQTYRSGGKQAVCLESVSGVFSRWKLIAEHPVRHVLQAVRSGRWEENLTIPEADAVENPPPVLPPCGEGALRGSEMSVYRFSRNSQSTAADAVFPASSVNTAFPGSNETSATFPKPSGISAIP